MEAVDTRISQLEKKTESGVFANESPRPILADELLYKESPESTTASAGLAIADRPRPVLIASIEIIDTELWARCLEQFQQDDQRDRLDTVVTEATRILENRIRHLRAFRGETVGVELAKAAFLGSTPLLKLSDVSAEQEAAHLLFRGFFGFVRNQVHHRLVGELRPERVVQVLGFADYLISLAEGAASGRSGPSQVG